MYKYKWILRLKNQKEISLKDNSLEKLGFYNLKYNSFEPTYNYYKQDNKIIIRIEAPGNFDISSSIDYCGEYTIIRLYGNKKRDKEPKRLEDNIFNSRIMGYFNIHIPLKTKDYLIKNELPIIKERNGIFILEYNLNEKIKEEIFKLKEEDEF